MHYINWWATPYTFERSGQLYSPYNTLSPQSDLPLHQASRSVPELHLLQLGLDSTSYKRPLSLLPRAPEPSSAPKPSLLLSRLPSSQFSSPPWDQLTWLARCSYWPTRTPQSPQPLWLCSPPVALRLAWQEPPPTPTHLPIHVPPCSPWNTPASFLSNPACTPPHVLLHIDT